MAGAQLAGDILALGLPGATLTGARGGIAQASSSRSLVGAQRLEALTCMNCVTVGKSYKLAEPQFPRLYNGDSSTCLSGVVWSL